jgi:hypothetical protein
LNSSVFFSVFPQIKVVIFVAMKFSSTSIVYTAYVFAFSLAP